MVMIMIMVIMMIFMISIPWFDPAGGVAVGVLIAKTGVDLMSGNYYNLMDRQDLNENKEMIAHCKLKELSRNYILVKEQGIPCCSLRHRHHGPLMYVDLKIEVDPSTPALKMMEVRR